MTSRARLRLFAGASASTTIRFDAASHQPSVDPGIGLNETVPERPGERLKRCEELGVRVSGQRLAGRFQRHGVRAR
jgi:hypothetical protein